MIKKSRKRFLVVLSTTVSILLIILIFVYTNVPLRTAIFRSFEKQSVYIVSDNDTLYNFGYFGVQKLLVNRQDGSTTLLKENSAFTHNCFVGHLIGRSGAIRGNYLYVAARSYLGGKDTSNVDGYLNGEFLILRKSDLQLIKQIPVDFKMIEAKVYEKYLLITGMFGFNIYNTSNPQNPKVIYSYRTKRYEEYQGCDFFKNGDNIYFAIARFGDGVSIYRLETSKVSKIVDLPIKGTPTSSGALGDGLQVFRLTVQYPYIYATLGPIKNYFGTKNDKRGIIIYNISNMNDIRKVAVLVPRQYYYSRVTGDPQPSHIATYRNKIYVNFCEKGVAEFSIPTNRTQSRFLKLLNIFDSKMILPICIDSKGMMYVGSFYNEDIYTHQLK